MSGRTGIASGVTASANHAASGHAASALVDGSYLTYWDNGGTLTDNLTFDQGSSKRVAYLALNQREDSITQTATSSRRIHNYRIQTSNDNSTWSTLKSGTLPNARGVQFIDVGATARYIRLVVDTLYSDSDTLRVDEAWLGSAYASGGTTQPPATRVEMESGTCDGTIDSNHTGFSGTGFCNTTNAAGAAGQVTVNAASAGSYQLTVRYSNGTTSDRPSDIAVNGTVVSAAHSFPVTADWDTWSNVTVTVNLNAGANTVRVTGTTAGGAPNLDYVEF
jgi:alpha-L-fucosidase